MTDPPDLALPSIEAIAGLDPQAARQAAPRLAALLEAARLAAAGNGARARSVPGNLLTMDEVATRTAMSKSWLYRHAKHLPFARRIGRKVLFDDAGLTRWLANRGR